jgi:hypothetical protein
MKLFDVFESFDAATWLVAVLSILTPVLLLLGWRRRERRRTSPEK